MKDIRFYDFSMVPNPGQDQLRLILPRYTSCNWEIYFNQVGSFELRLPKNDEVAALLFDVRDLLVIQDDKQAIVTGYQIGAEIAIFGRTLNVLLRRRCIKPTEGAIGTAGNRNAEALARTVVGKYYTSAAETPGDGFLTLDTATGGFTKQVQFWRNTLTEGDDFISDLLGRDNAGHRVYYDRVRRLWLFKVLKGRETPFVFSSEMRNAYDVQQSLDYNSEYNAGWYDEEQPATEEGAVAPTIWRDIVPGKTGIYRKYARLSATGRTEAENELTAMKALSETVFNSLAEEGRDYLLGDTVRLQVSIAGRRVTKRFRVIGVTYWIEPNNIGQRPILEEVTE